MNTPVCNLCGGEVNKVDQTCPHCGVPVHSSVHKSPQRRFVMFFIFVVFFCLFMIYWLPPDWTAFISK